MKVFCLCLCFVPLWEAGPSSSAHFWLLHVPSCKQWHFTGRLSSSFLPGFLSIVLPDLANSMPPPHSPNSSTTITPPPTPINQQISVPPQSDSLNTRKWREKWADKEEMINDNRATRGSCGSGTYHANKQGALTCRWWWWQSVKLFNVLFGTYSALNF